MKWLLKKRLFLLPFFLFFLSASLPAQTFEHAGEYMDFIGKANDALTIKYLTYMSAVSHGKSARKVEKRRIEVVNAISDTKFNIMGMPPWKGDRSLKDSTVAYLKILNTVFNEDYGKIVNMEEIAEQSYDAMEAYLLAQEKAYEKLDQALKRQHDAQKKFADKNNVTLIESTSELESKSKPANAVLAHCNEVYLVFFKPNKQEGYMIDAMNKKNLVSLEQDINSLGKMADDGAEKLKKITGYNNDASLITACKKILAFYKSEASQSASLTDFFLKEESFVKIKKQFEAKPASKRTQQDIDQYNKAIDDMNAASKSFNSVNSKLNKERSDALDDWNKAYNKYLDEYMPKQQRQ